MYLFFLLIARKFTMVDLFEINGFTKIFRRSYALRNVSFKVLKGECVAVIGKNGAGKTTLFNAISGFLSPNRGKVYFNAKEIKPPFETRGIIGFLPHELFLYNDLSPSENLLLFGEFYRVENLKQKIEEILDIVGLKDEKDKRVSFFSRGMKQRLSIARLLISNTPLWLLDEPSTGLDEEGRLWLWNTLKNEHLNGRIILISTHIKEEVEKVCNRVIVLKKGDMVYEGRKGEGDWVGEAFKKL